MRSSAEKGRSISKDLSELLNMAARNGRKPESGGGSSADSKPGGEDSKPENMKKGQEEKKDPLADNQEEKGRPEGGEKSKSPPDKKADALPPKSDKVPPPIAELKGVFLARLPDKVREAVMTGDFDQVPEKYRELVRAWTKALAEADEKARKEASAK